ncbi:MAG: hypothetical protein AB3N23_05685 [Paracoccaceae bacterium]
MSRETQTTVRRRRVFYFPGYDPVHSRKYREPYRKEAAAQAKISGYDIALKAKQTEATYGWRIESRFDGQDISSDMEVMVWSDIVRNSMSNSIPATYRQLTHVAWTYIASGALWRLMRLRKGPVIAALYPVIFLLLQLVLALGLAWGLGAIGAALLGWMGQVVGILLGLGAGAFVIRWFRDHDNLFYIYYLLHNYAYSAQHQGVTPADLAARLDEFTDIIARALREDVDEVLIVGHSSGAHLAVSVLADLIRSGRVPDNGPALSFLSLGQVVPMVAFLPRAYDLRADLQYLSTRPELTWIDVTAPGDGCTFALCDPVAVTGVAPEGKRWPLVVSAAFSQTLKPETWANLRWKFFRLHFQYLCAFDAPGDYDYFAITAGPRLLADRYAGRQPSKSRIEAAVSKYTSVQPA